MELKFGRKIKNRDLDFWSQKDMTDEAIERRYKTM